MTVKKFIRTFWHVPLWIVAAALAVDGCKACIDASDRREEAKREACDNAVTEAIAPGLVRVWLRERGERVVNLNDVSYVHKSRRHDDRVRIQHNIGGLLVCGSLEDVKAAFADAATR